MAEADAEPAFWLRSHRYLKPAGPEAGESGMAMLMSWKVEHGQEYPAEDGIVTMAKLLGFTKRLKRRVAADPELLAWLDHKDLQQPLAPGLASAHHLRWGVIISAPPPNEPRGWYGDFLGR